MKKESVTDTENTFILGNFKVQMEWIILKYKIFKLVDGQKTQVNQQPWEAPSVLKSSPTPIHPQDTRPSWVYKLFFPNLQGAD